MSNTSQARIKVEFSGEVLKSGRSGIYLRACAGGVDDHAADFQHRVHTRQITATFTSEGQPLPNVTFEFRFDGNEGHDYKDDREIVTARIHAADEPFDAEHSWEETLRAKTDSEGKVKFWVKSGDVICQPTLQTFDTRSQDEDELDTKLKCDFAGAIPRRGFRDWNRSASVPDDGWLFNRNWLGYPGAQTTAKVYLQFKVDDTKGDASTNWVRVNGHFMVFTVVEIDLRSGSKGTPVNNYAVVVNMSDAAISAENVAVYHTRNDGKLDGAATTMVQANGLIDAAEKVHINAYDLNQWDQ